MSVPQTYYTTSREIIKLTEREREREKERLLSFSCGSKGIAGIAYTLTEQVYSAFSYSTRWLVEA